MLFENKYLIGNVPYSIDYDSSLTSGPVWLYPQILEFEADTVIIPPKSVEFEGIRYDFRVSDLGLHAKQIISYQEPREFTTVDRFTGTDKGIRHIVFPMKVSRPYLSDTPLTIEYLQGVDDLEGEISTPSMHVVFGDEVKEVGVINGGHVSLGKEIKGIRALRKADVRIDVRSITPPSLGVVSPGAMACVRLHVPVGALEAYASHPQWDNAAEIVEDDVPAAALTEQLRWQVEQYDARLAGALQKIREDIAKHLKVKALALQAHEAIGRQKLAKWDVEIMPSNERLSVKIWFHYIGIEFGVTADHPIEVWDNLIARLEKAEQYLSHC